MPLITLKVLRGFVIGTGRTASVGDIIKGVPEYLAKTFIHTGKAELYVAEATHELEVDDDVPDTEDGDALGTEDDDAPSTEDGDASSTADDDAPNTEATDKVQANPLIQRTRAGGNSHKKIRKNNA